MSDYANALGRLLISIVFIYFGFLQFTNIAGYAANPAVLKFVAASLGRVQQPGALFFRRPRSHSMIAGGRIDKPFPLEVLCVPKT